MTVKTNPPGRRARCQRVGHDRLGQRDQRGRELHREPEYFTVGGTVSGLSGTVVLQDNGGDDLTVTANGSFTFATQAGGGAAYAVTVKTNPCGADLQRLERLGDGGVGERDQRGR